MSDHPLIEQSKKNTASEGLNPDEFTGDTVLKFMCQHPDTRKQVLDQLDSVIAADDGTGLRKKASLINMGRTLSRTHRSLLKANR